MYPYRKIIERILNQLNQSKNLNLKKFSGQDGIPESKYNDEALLRMFNRLLEKGMIINDSLVQLYLVGPELRWDWQSTTSTELIGVLNLYHQATALASGYNGEISDNVGINRFVFEEDAPPNFVNYGVARWTHLTDEQKDFFNAARYIDANQQSGVYVCIKRIQDKGGLEYNHNELWLFHDQSFKYFRLNVDITEYFDLLALSKGATFWQYLLLDNPENIVDEYIMKYLLIALNKLEQTFPGDDYRSLYTCFNDKYINMVKHFIQKNPNSELKVMLDEFLSMNL